MAEPSDVQRLVTQLMGGAARADWGRIEGVDPAVATTARAVIRRRSG